MENYLIYYKRSIYYEIKDVNIKCMRHFFFIELKIFCFCFCFYYNKKIKKKKRRLVIQRHQFGQS